MNVNQARDWRNVLLKSFLIGFVLLWISFICYLMLRGHLVAFTGKLFCLSPKVINAAFLGAYSMFDVGIVVFFLVPGLAFHWKYLKKRNALHR